MEAIVWKDRRRRFGLPLSMTRYSLSESRLFVRTGLFNADSEEIDLNDVRDVRVTHSAIDRLVGCGTITLFAQDRVTPLLLVSHVRRPYEVKEQLDTLILAERRRRDPQVEEEEALLEWMAERHRNDAPSDQEDDEEYEDLEEE